jgi:hypothetical protein
MKKRTLVCFGHMKKNISMFLIVLIVVFPLLAQEQTGQSSDEAVQGRIDGEVAAKGDNALFWAGCLLGVLAVAGAYIIAPSPTMPSLIGKSPTYIDAYTKGYKAKKKRLDEGKALEGCFFNIVGVLLGYFCAYLPLRSFPF